MSKFTAKKRLNNKKLIKAPLGYSKAFSFNDESTFSNETRYLIVGTLTPKDGRDAGYFYCSEANKQFELIDKGFNDGESLLEIKNRLRKDKQNMAIIKELKLLLNKRKIAFLDVVKVAVANDNSASDDEIISYILDYNSFKKIDFNKVKVAANSKNVKVALNLILKKNGYSDAEINKVELIPQMILGYWNRYSCNNELEHDWKEFFS